MKIQFFTRNLCLGLLMTLVLAFSVQGIADALTFSTSRSGDLETKAPNEQFTIRFSVSLKGNTAIRSGGNLVKDSTTTGGAANHRIDSSGYLVVEINDKEYRTIDAATISEGTLVVDPRPTYDTETPAAAGNPAAGRYVDTSGNVVDGDGDAVYVQTGAGIPADPAADPPVAADPWRYTRAKAKPTAKVDDQFRYHYNEETIGIDFAGPARIIKVGSRTVSIAGDTGAVDGTANLSMYERTHPMYDSAAEHQKLSGSVTLVLEPTGTDGGVVTVIVRDTSLPSDAPTNRQVPIITFTLYVVKYPTGVTTTNGVTNFATGEDGVGLALDNDERALSAHFTFADDAEVPVHYEVEGSGTLSIQQLYTGGSPPSVKTASKTLSTSSSAPVFIDMRRGTSKVTASVSRGGKKTMIFIYQGNTAAKYHEIEITQGDGQTGATRGQLADSLKVKVTDGNNRPVAGVAVGFTSDDPDNPTTASMFIPVPGTIVYGSGSTLTAAPLAATATFVDATKPDTTEATSSKPGAGASIVVQTNRNGEAETYFQLSSNMGAHQVTATLQGDNSFDGAINIPFDADAADVSSGAAETIRIVDGDGQRADAEETLDDPLVVEVRNTGGRIVEGANVKFTTNSGALARPDSLEGDPGVYVAPAEEEAPHTQRFIVVNTDETGRASVRYNVGDLPGAKEIFATIDVSNGRTKSRTFNVNGRASRPSDDAGDDEGDDGDGDDDPVRVSVPSSVSGTAGETRTLRVTAPATASVTVGGRDDTFPGTNTGRVRQVDTTYTSTLTLPDEADTYSLTVFVGDDRHAVSVRVTEPEAPTGGRVRVSVSPGRGAPRSTATVTVTATDSDGDPASGVSVTLSITSGGGTLSPTTVETDTDGTATSTLTFGSTPGSEYYITASAPTGYTFSSQLTLGERVTITGTDTRTPPPAPAGEPAEVFAFDGEDQTGVLNTPLSEPLVVEVVDGNDNPVERVRVRFRTTRGSGRFSPRSNVRTDEDGLAEITFTPTSPGRIRISARVPDVSGTAVFNITAGAAPDSLTQVSGDTQSGTPGNALANPFVVEVKDADGEPIEGISVTFSVTAGGGSLSARNVPADEDGRAETTLTLGSEPGVNSVQASVPGVDPVTFSTSIEAKILVAAANRPVMYWIDSGALYQLSGAKAAMIAEAVNGVAVGGGKLYWTSQTGAIQSANLDGSGVTELASIFAVPMGIAVDTAGSKLYWTNTGGRIQSANLNGSGIKNVLQNLSDPTDIAVSNGFIYWTEGGNSIRRVNTSGQKVTRDVAANLDTVGGLAVGGGKVYWTEQTSASAGTVNGANLNGTNFETLATLLSAPMGISVDTAGSKLYWTNSRGRVQSANLDGSRIKNVVEGLISASKIAIGGANTETTTTTTTKATTPAKKDNAKYDVNNDGKVDNADAALVAGAMNTGDAKFDVNDDGAVNFLDLLLVFDNRDDDAAGAPTIVGMKLSAVQIDRIQEQIELLIATGDRSPAAMRTLIYLQQLLVMARPGKTQLLANYPNPFNPETWIPYELATDTDVRITIYNTQGVVIRRLQLGQQSAGYYTDRDRAAYWDGRNALGEQVASGLYFYQFETDEMSSMRKMVILK